HVWGGTELWPMTDIGGGIFSLIVTAIFLKFWKPKKEWHFDSQESGVREQGSEVRSQESASGTPDAHAAEAAALVGDTPATPTAGTVTPLTAWSFTVAWGPYIIMSILLMLTGLIRQHEVPVTAGPGPVTIVDGLHTNYQIPVPLLHNEVLRDEKLHDKSRGP